MRPSARLPEMYANLGNEAHEEPSAKKNRWDIKHSNIATLDNGTMIEAFKHLNYGQLAANSLVSKRFRNVIHTHRHKLALLYVDTIRMDYFPITHAAIKVFEKELSSEAYDKWVIRNSYSKQVPHEDQIVSAQGTENDYQLVACANYKDPYRELRSKFTALYARVKLNDETWPVFEHFVNLLTDPFVHICWMQLIPQKETFNVLAAKFDRSDRSSLQCEELSFNFEATSLKFFNWIKDHVRCGIFQLAVSNRGANRGKQLLDFFATGSHCAPKILVGESNLLKPVIIGLAQKFMDLKSCDECHIVHLIRGYVIKSTAESLKSKYAKFFVKEESKETEFGRMTIMYDIYELVNTNIGKKMRLAISLCQVTMEIINS